jgi:hypothetical protein
MRAPLDPLAERRVLEAVTRISLAVLGEAHRRAEGDPRERLLHTVDYVSPIES